MVSVSNGKYLFALETVSAVLGVDLVLPLPRRRDPDISLLQNLKDLLDVDFPSRAALEKSVSNLLFF